VAGAVGVGVSDAVGPGVAGAAGAGAVGRLFATLTAGSGGALLVSVVVFVSAGSSATAIAPTGCSAARSAEEAGASRSGAVPPVFSSVNG